MDKKLKLYVICLIFDGLKDSNLHNQQKKMRF